MIIFREEGGKYELRPKYRSLPNLQRNTVVPDPQHGPVQTFARGCLIDMYIKE